MKYAKIIAVSVTAVVYLLVALATGDSHGLTYGPYPLPIITGLICLLAVAITVAVAKDWMVAPKLVIPVPHDPDAPAPASNWTRWQYAILIGLTLITCRLVHQEIRIWCLDKGRAVLNSTHRLHHDGHKLIKDANGREMMEIHLDGSINRDLQTRFVFHGNK